MILSVFIHPEYPQAYTPDDIPQSAKKDAVCQMKYDTPIWRAKPQYINVNTYFHRPHMVLAHSYVSYTSRRRVSMFVTIVNGTSATLTELLSVT